MNLSNINNFYFEIFGGECQESNLGLLGEKQVCFCAMQPGSHGVIDRAVTCKARGRGFNPNFIQMVFFSRVWGAWMEPDMINLRDLALPKHCIEKIKILAMPSEQKFRLSERSCSKKGVWYLKFQRICFWEKLNNLSHTKIKVFQTSRSKFHFTGCLFLFWAAESKEKSSKTLKPIPSKKKFSQTFPGL